MAASSSLASRWNDFFSLAQLQGVDAVQFDMASARLSGHLPSK